MNYPKITVVTPSYNQAAFLEETILSVLEQAYPNLQYIIIDGGSTDGSVEIIKKYEHHLDFWVSEKDSGQSEAINKGLKRAQGEIVTWLNSDDLFIPKALQNVAEVYLSNPDVGLIYGKTILFGDTKEQVAALSDSELPARYLSGMIFSQPSAFFTQSILSKVGLLHDGLHFGMDYDFFLRMYLNSDFVKTDCLFSKYRLHDSSKTVSSYGKFAIDWARVYSKLLRTIPSMSTKLIDHMKHLGIYHDGEDVYSYSRQLTKEQLNRSFLYFLKFQVHFNYEVYQLEQVVKLSQTIKKIDPEFYSTHVRIMALRAMYLPKGIISTLRKISR